MTYLSSQPYLSGGDAVTVACRGVLVLIAGQSGAESHELASTLSSANASLASAYANVTMLSKQDTTVDDPMVWQTVGPQSLQSTSYTGAGGLNTYVGIELSLMRDLDQALPSRRFAMARFAVGGASSAEYDPHGTYPTSPANGPNLYSQLISYVQSAMTTLSCSSLVVVWMHGETDARTVNGGTAYRTWMDGFVDALRASLGPIGPGGVAIPLICSKVNTNLNPATFVGLAQCRASQVSVASDRSNVVLVSLDSLNPAGAGQHYSADQDVTIGHLMSPSVAGYCGVRVQPVASFSYARTGLSVACTDTSVSYGDTITSWAWTTSDGQTSTQQNPTFTFATKATYGITVTVTNSHGDTDASATSSVPVIGGIAGVTRDALSQWYTPASATEWNAFHTDSSVNSAFSSPDALHLFQETSGNAADSIGSLTLTAAANDAYRQSVSGWERLAITFADGTARGLSTTSSSLPDLSTTSMAWIGYVKFPSSAPAVDRGIIALGTSASTRCAIILKTTGKIAVQSTTSNTTIGTINMCDGRVALVALMCNRTGTAVTGFTVSVNPSDGQTVGEKISPTFGATMTGKGLYIGSQFGAASTFGGGVLYAATYYGAKAEKTSAQWKTEVQGLTGLSVAWS